MIYGFKRVFEPLIKDIRYLETVGVRRKIACNINGTVLYVAADNLASNSLGGFQESFNVEKFCRLCLINHEQIQTCDVRSGNFVIRTPELYDEVYKYVEEK